LSVSKAKAEPAPKPKREPTERERKAFEGARAAQAARPARASLDVQRVKGTTVQVDYPHSDARGGQALIYEALGTTSHGFADNALVSLITAVASGSEGATSNHYSAGLALMGAVAPQNELETAIGLQIVAAHYAALEMTRRARLNAGEYVNSAAAYANMATKFSRTVAAHVEALSKLRSGGKQTHEVRYVYVNGPAAFGPGAKAAAAYGGGGSDIENLGQSHANPALDFDPGAPVPQMRGQDAEGNTVSGAGGERAAAMPDARWHEPGSASGQG
jgi:hypothetical protein